jgi:transposase-like protein
MSRVGLIDKLLRSANKQSEIDSVNEEMRINNFTKEDETEYVIECLKSMPYGEFLKTVYWKKIKDKKLREAKYKCAVCNSKLELNVHHKTYSNHGKEHANLDDLVVLCSECHAIFHGKLWEGK